MHPLVGALLSRWEFRPEIVIVLVTFGVLYSLGWMRLRQQRHTESKLATKRRLLCYLGGLIVLAISLMSPIDRLGTQLFFMHMIQHLLSIMIAAPLLWLGDPFPIMVWGMPRRARRVVSRVLSGRLPGRTLLVAVTKPGLSWLIFIAVYLGWHDQNAYGLALTHAWIHDVQHLTFFAVAMLFWWHVIGAAPHLHKTLPAWGRMAFLLATIPPNMLTGVAIAFANQPIYSYYETVPRIWGFTVMEDQMASGIVMWIPGSMMFLVGALIIAAQLLKGPDGSAPLSVKDLSDESVMIAPGLEHRVIQNRWRRLQESKVQTSDVP